MTLANRLGWTSRKGYVPAAFAVTAFAFGVQIALVTEALGASPYPPEGKAVLAWGSALVLAASALLHVPWREAWTRLAQALPDNDIPRREVHLAPRDPVPTRPRAAELAHNGQGEIPEADLKARVHSPLASGPVLCPGEEASFTIEAEPEGLARELEVRITIDGPDGRRTTRERMRGTKLEHPLVFEETGEFTVSIELDHPRSQPVAKTLRGRVAPYREEVASLFEQLKEQASASGLDVDAGSTPREVCRRLRQLDESDPASLADLVVELEVALYGDEEVDRASYETVYAAIADTGPLDGGTRREVTR